MNTNTPSGASGSGWEQMDGLRQYFMAKAMFADYAQFGRFLVNYEWLISSIGTVGGSSYDCYSEEYYKFDPQLMPKGSGTVPVYQPTVNVNTTYARKSDYFNIIRGVSYTIEIDVTPTTAASLTVYAQLFNNAGCPLMR